jgi:hypothetical protein
MVFLLLQFKRAEQKKNHTSAARRLRAESSALRPGARTRAHTQGVHNGRGVHYAYGYSVLSIPA